MQRNAPKKSSTPRVSQIGEKKPVSIKASQEVSKFVNELKNNKYIGFYLSEEVEKSANKDELLNQKEIAAYQQFVQDEKAILDNKLRQEKSLAKDREIPREDKISTVIRDHFGITKTNALQLYQIYYIIIDKCDPQGVASLDKIRKLEIFEGKRALAQADKMISENGKDRVKLIRYKKNEKSDQPKLRQTLEARENEFKSIYHEACKYAEVWVQNDMIPVLQGTDLQSLYNNTDKRQSNFNQGNFDRVQSLQEEITKYLLDIIWRRFMINFAMEIATERNDRNAVANLSILLQNEPALILRDDIAKKNTVDENASINTPRKGRSYADSRRATIFTQLEKQQEEKQVISERARLLGDDEPAQPGCCPPCNIM